MKCCHQQGKPCDRAAQVLVTGGDLVLPMCCWHAAAYRKASPVPTTERPIRLAGETRARRVTR